jgi:hypothetical protein
MEAITYQNAVCVGCVLCWCVVCAGVCACLCEFIFARACVRACMRACVRATECVCDFSTSLFKQGVTLA